MPNNVPPPVWGNPMQVNPELFNFIYEKPKKGKVSQKETEQKNIESIFELPQLEELSLKEIDKIKYLFPSKEKIKYTSLVGLEIEVENIINRPLLSPVFDCVEDGSLRNNGIEYVSAPIPANVVPEVLSYFKMYLNGNNIPIYSHRTSIHLHVNIRDFSVEQLKSFLFLYLCLENLLYQFAGENRNKSIFCIPLSHTHYVDNFKTLFKKNCSLKELTEVVRSWHKYTGCNLNPIRKYGTIEFRHLPGTEDIHKICNWINLILSIQEYAKITPIEKLFSIAENLNTNSEYELFLNEIFKEYMPLFIPYNIQQEMEKDILHIKKCLFLLQEQKTPSFDKETFKNSIFYKVYKIKESVIKNEYWSMEELCNLSLSALRIITTELEEKYRRASPEECLDIQNKYILVKKAMQKKEGYI